MSLKTYTCIWLVSSIYFALTALNSRAITANLQPCLANEIGDNILLSYNVGTTVTLPDFRGVCLRSSLSLEKIGCRKKDSSLTECVNESSTASLCHNNTVDIYAKKNPDGNYTIFVNASKELIGKCTPVHVTAHFQRLSRDRTCYYNESATEMASNQMHLTEKPTSKFSPAGTAPTNSPSSLKADPDVDTTTNSTVTPSLKPDPDAGTPTNSSTVSPSLKPHPDAGKLKVDQIVGIVFGVILVVLILASLFYIYYRCKKKRARREEKNRRIELQSQ